MGPYVRDFPCRRPQHSGPTKPIRLSRGRFPLGYTGAYPPRQPDVVALDTWGGGRSLFSGSRAANEGPEGTHESGYGRYGSTGGIHSRRGSEGSRQIGRRSLLYVARAVMGSRPRKFQDTPTRRVGAEPPSDARVGAGFSGARAGEILGQLEKSRPRSPANARGSVLSARGREAPANIYMRVPGTEA